MEAHLDRRHELIGAEKALRHDHRFRQNLSCSAKKACEIVSAIRREEIRTTWTGLQHASEQERYPGMLFVLAKETLEKTRLWQVIRRLPKGALLHAHFEGMVDMRWFLEMSCSFNGMHIKSDVPLNTPHNLLKSKITFVYLAKPSRTAAASIFSAEYPPNQPVSWANAAESFPEGGRAKFFEFLVSRVTITPQESLLAGVSIDGIWEKFQSVFGILDGLVFYEPILRVLIPRFLAQMLEDRVHYVDLRMAFVTPLQLESGEVGTTQDIIRVFQEELHKFQATPGGEQLWGARIIWTIHRSASTEVVKQSMKECIEAKKRYPDIISGFDLVGQEGRGETLKFHLNSLLEFRSESIRQGVDIPFFFHAGEVLGDGDEHDLNIVDALLLGTKRIGHGYSLYKHPLIMEEVKKQDVCLEVCPISNEVLRLCAGISSHPLPALLANGLPVAIANDDPGILGQGSTGLSHDFWQVLQAFENVGLEGLGDLAQTSVWYAAFGDGNGGEEEIGEGKGAADGVRHRYVKQWREDWEEFCEWVVEKYGSVLEKK